MTATEQNQARIETQMKRIVEQSTVINRQAQIISDLLDACIRAEWWLSTVEDSDAIREIVKLAITKAKGTTP